MNCLHWFIDSMQSAVSLPVFSKRMFENLNMIFPVDTLMQKIEHSWINACNFCTVLYMYMCISQSNAYTLSYTFIHIYIYQSCQLSRLIWAWESVTLTTTCILWCEMHWSQEYETGYKSVSVGSPDIPSWLCALALGEGQCVGAVWRGGGGAGTRLWPAVTGPRAAVHQPEDEARVRGPVRAGRPRWAHQSPAGKSQNLFLSVQ